MKNKIYVSFSDAVADIPDGATVMMHSFTGPGGVAQNLIRALRDRGSKDLTVICCNFILGWVATGLLPEIVTPNALIENKQVKKVITTFIGTSRLFGVACALEKAVAAGEVEVELTSQGILAERIRAGGAGIGGFYCPVGIGTIVDDGKKEKRIINGREYLLEMPLRADFALVRAYKADKIGNLIYRRASRSFNPVIATAADVVIAEVDQIVETGELDPDVIITPSVYVNRIVEIPKGKSK